MNGTADKVCPGCGCKVDRVGSYAGKIFRGNIYLCRNDECVMSYLHDHLPDDGDILELNAGLPPEGGGA